jgi:hypothetical protein
MEIVMDIRCVVACKNASGQPDFFGCTLTATQEEYDNGEHYDAAAVAAEEEGYEGPFVVYDENDGPAWLFAHVGKAADELNERREQAAERAFATYDFGEAVLNADGWDIRKKDEWTQVYYVEVAGGSSLRREFVVRFKPGTADVEAVHAG